MIVSVVLLAKRTPPQFVAHVDVEIAPRTVANDGPEDVRHIHQFELDSEQAGTELEILKSGHLLRAVFEGLDLADSPELSPIGIGPSSSLQKNQAEFASFSQRVRCLRIGMSYVFEVSYRSGDPQTAARVANALGAAYLADRIDRERARQTKSGGAYRAERWQALAEQSQISRAAVRTGASLEEDFYAANARILSPASPPLGKSSPRLGLIAALAAGIGLISGVIVTLAFAAVRTSHFWDAESAAGVNTSRISG